MPNQDCCTEADCDNDALSFQKHLAKSGKRFHSVDNFIPDRSHGAA